MPALTRPRFVLLACGLALAACLVSTRDVPLGGKWFIRWETSQLAESGGRHPFLHRTRWYGSVRVEENTWRYRYLGDDCVLFVAGNSDRGQLYAACADSAPTIIATAMADSTLGYAGDMGLTGDTLFVEGRSVPVLTILQMAKSSRRED
jgi:hypothetical protein